MMDVVPMGSSHKTSMIVHELLGCYNVAQEDQDKEDPINMQIPETEGKNIVEGPDLECFAYA
jgi:hypothetical protein